MNPDDDHIGPTKHHNFEAEMDRNVFGEHRRCLTPEPDIKTGFRLSKELHRTTLKEQIETQGLHAEVTWCAQSATAAHTNSLGTVWAALVKRRSCFNTSLRCRRITLPEAPNRSGAAKTATRRPIPAVLQC